MKTLRHPPSKELWKFCMERLRELRGPDTRERDLANILGFEHSRAVRWKEGQMYVDRAEYLVRLADALDVEPMLLVAMASGTPDGRAGPPADRRARTDRGRQEATRAAARAEPIEVAADASTVRPRLEPSSRPADAASCCWSPPTARDGRAGRGAGPAPGRQRPGGDGPLDRAHPGGALPPGAGVPRPRRGQRPRLRGLPRLLEPHQPRRAPLPRGGRDREP